MFNSINKKKIVLTYFGISSDEITSSLIGVVEQAKKDKERKKLLRKMPVLIAECFQNIVRHGTTRNLDHFKTGDHRDYFQIQIDDGIIIMSSVNLVENDKVESIENSLDFVNSLGADDLKSLKKNILMNGKLSEKGGAGLGLIDMASKTGDLLRNKFVKINDKYSQFFLALSLGENPSSEVSIQDIQDEFIELNKEKVLVLYKGDFSWSTSSFIIEMLEENFKGGESQNQNYHQLSVIIEVLQNSAKHGFEKEGVKEGVFAIFAKEQGLSIYCGNYIEEENAKLLKQSLDEIKNSSIKDINEMYRKKLLSSALSEEGNAGLGILEIARQTNKGIDYNIFEDADKMLYLSLEVQL